jgi:predicted DsbA family dithiol-disulfide isomerase
VFWTYLDKLYEVTPGNNRVDLSILPKIAGDLGVDVDAFNLCLKSGKYDDKIAQQTRDGFASGAQGTPFSIIITPEGNQVAIPGAQPIEVWRQAIDSIIANEITNKTTGEAAAN